MIAALTAASALTFLSLVGPSEANESSADFFRADRERMERGSNSPFYSGNRNTDTGAMSPAKNKVAEMVASEARSRLGENYVNDALRLTKLESEFRCHVLGPKTRHGRAVGPLQVLPSSAKTLGVENLHSDCKAQIRAGILHMEKCISVGAKSYSQLAACHVAGWGGWNKKLNRRAQAYRNKYIRMAQAQKVPSWAGTLSTW